MKKALMVMAMAMAIVAMVPPLAQADAFHDWYAGRTKWDGTPIRHHGHSHRHHRHGRHHHGGVAKVVEMKMKNDQEDQKYMIVYHDGHIAVVCANGTITDESSAPINRDAIGIAGVLGALGIIVGAH